MISMEIRDLSQLAWLVIHFVQHINIPCNYARQTKQEAQFHYESMLDVDDIEQSTMESISNVKKKVY